MKEKVTIVPVDIVIIVDGEVLNIEGLDGIAITEDIHSSSIHAIQWANGTGHVEFKDNATANTLLSGEDDYDVWVAPFVQLWETEKVSQDTAQAMAEAEELALYNSSEARAERMRIERDARITACDWIISRHAEQVALGVDTTLTAEEYAEWLGYRQELRDLPSVEGFPWSGGGVDDAACPWPVEPDGEEVSVPDGFEEDNAEVI